jgi:hypothetical protein
MNILRSLRRLGSAAAVFFGGHGAVSQLARRREVSRPSLYREAEACLQNVEGTAARQEVQELHAECDRLRRRVVDLESRLGAAVEMDAGRQACFAATAQAEGVSLPTARRLLGVLLGAAAPSVARLGRWTRAAGRAAAARLAILDEATRPRVEQAAGDEIFFGGKPCLMAVEQHSLCWLTGRLTERRDGEGWAAELRTLPRLRQFTRDAGQALSRGVALANAERRRQGREPFADQEDHFHALRAAGPALRGLRDKTARLTARAELAERRAARRTRERGGPGSLAGAATRAWRAAERAMDVWSAAEKTYARIREALRLFTPDGELNTRPRAEATLDATLATLAGPQWSKARRMLRRPRLLTFLDETARGLEALPVGAEVRQAAVQVEGLRRRPEALRDAGPAAGALRGMLWAAGLVLTLSGPAGPAALTRVREVLDGAWRASSLVECINSVARMQQSRHRRMTQGLLDLKRLYWNCRKFRTGKRRDRTPYELLGLTPATTDWWNLLQASPEQLRQELFDKEVAA